MKRKCDSLKKELEKMSRAAAGGYGYKIRVRPLTNSHLHSLHILHRTSLRAASIQAGTKKSKSL